MEQLFSHFSDNAVQNLPDEALDGFIESFIRGGTSTEALARAQAEKERRRRLQALPGVIAAAAVAGGEDPSALRTPAHRPARNGRRRAAGSASTAAAAAEGDDGSDEEWLPNTARASRQLQQAARGAGSLPAGMVAVANGPPSGRQRPTPRRPRATPASAPRVQVVQTIRPSITPSSYDGILSVEPVWMLANRHLPESERFGMPSAELTSLHRKVNGNLSRFMRGSIRQILVAHIMMKLCMEISKQEDIFGRDQGVNGGGPYLACGKTIFRPPNTLKQHAETHLKGFCQLSKTYETCGEAFHCYFVEGILPTIFVRNKGGASVGTADMTKGIVEFNVVVKRIFDSIKHLYAHLSEFAEVKATDFWLHPRRSSYQETLEFQGNGRETYLLRNPQVIIACTNTVQLQPFYNPPSGASARRALAAGQPLLSYMQIFSGERDTNHAEDANPYLPWIYEVSEVGQAAADNGGARLLPAIAALFDEDDSNRSSTGNEKKEELLFMKAPGLRERLNALQRASAAAEEVEEGEAGNEPEDRETAREATEAALFYKDFRGLRSIFALVVAYTATPTTALYAIGGGASEIDIHMVEITPGRSYIGYNTEHMAQMAPHLQRHVQVMQLPNRVNSMTFALKDIYPQVFEAIGDFDIKHDDVPQPFKRTAAGTITLPRLRADEAVHCPNGTICPAEHFRETAMEALGLTKVRADAFWYADGNNVTHILMDMEERKAEYPCGYRNALYMTNFSKSERGKQNFVSTILGFQGDSKRLSKGLVTIEYDHRYTRLTWLAGEVDEDVLAEAVQELLDSDDELAVEWARACAWGKGSATAAEDDEADEIESVSSLSSSEPTSTTAAHTLVSLCSNINYAYSVLHKYICKMRARPQAAGDPPFFLKMLAFAGEIGARGVRYKSAEHALVLTDMYYAFNVSATTQVTAHGAAVIQAIGRLCTLVLDLDGTPDIKLWIPSNCWDFCELWLDVMDSLPALYAHKQSGETTEELIERLATTQPPPPEFGRVFQHFAAPTGYNKKGAPFFARLDHRFTKAKTFAEQLAESTALAGTAPAPIDVEDNTVEMREATRIQAVDIAIQRGEAARQADPDDEDDEDAAHGVHAVMGPPAIGNLPSVPQPKRVKVARPPKAAGNKRKASSLEDGYTWEASDRKYALDALQKLRSMLLVHPPDGPPPPQAVLVEMFALRYCYFVYARGAAHCGPEGHGLKTVASRNNYAASMRHLTNAIGRSIFTSLDCLPQAQDQAERHRFKGLVRKYFERVAGGTADLTETGMYKKEIDNMTAHVLKYLQLFPPGNLSYFVYHEPVPAGLPNDGASSSSTRSEPIIVELSDDED